MFGVKGKKLSQEARILKALKKAGNKGVMNHQFPKMNILRYSARINDLRNDGHNILVERMYKDGRATGTFRYILRDER